MESSGDNFEKPIRAQSMVIVLAKKESSIRSTVTFLQRRGIAARYVSSLSEAIDAFAKKEANMLLLSVNFPHPKVEMLPVLMNQSFGIETIVYSEDSDRKSSSRLSCARTKHVLFGAVSGTVVMMKVRQIEREMNGTAEDAYSSTIGRSGADKNDKNHNDEIKIGGGRKSNDGDDAIVLNNKSNFEKQIALENLKKALLETEAETNISGELRKSGEIYVQKGQRSKMMSEVEEGPGSGLISARAQELRAGLDCGLSTLEAGAGKKRRLILPNETKTKPRAMNEADELLQREADIFHAPTEAAALSPATSSTTGVFSKVPTITQSAIAPSATSSLSELNSAPPGTRSGPAAAEKVEPSTDEEIIEACLRECLTIVAGATDPLARALQAYTTGALVSLRTSKISCAFIISLAHAPQTASELFHRIEIAFFSLMRDYGIEFEDRETHSIALDDLNIVKRAFEGSDFTAIVSQAEIEIGVAKVQVKNPVAEFFAYEENMLSVNLRDLPIDEPVTFSVFLHLKKNRKYLRYLKQGSTLTGPQASRLEITHPHVMLDQDEIEAYRRHFAAHAIQAPKRRPA